MNIGADDITLIQQGASGAAGHRRRMDNDSPVSRKHLHRLELAVIFKQSIKIGKFAPGRFEVEKSQAFPTTVLSDP